MGKVLRIYPPTADAETFMRQAGEQMIEDNDEPESMAVIIKQKNGSWRIGYYHMSFAEKMEAASHMHVDAIRDMIGENYATPD